MQHPAARFVKNRYSRYSSVSDTLGEWGGGAYFSKETGGLTNSVLQNYYRFGTSHFKGVLIEAYKGTRRNLDRLVIELTKISGDYLV